MIKTSPTVPDKSSVYATGGDFCQIFHEEMNPLYFLGLLLTGDSAKAETCFVAGLDDCSDGKPVFKEWARSWARRTIVQNAIRLIGPKPGHSDWIPGSTARGKIADANWNASLHLNAVLELPVFDRFVFVMLVLEKYSEHECSLLLGCTRRDVIAARERAFGYLAADRPVGRPPEILQPVVAA